MHYSLIGTVYCKSDTKLGLAKLNAGNYRKLVTQLISKINSHTIHCRVDRMYLWHVLESKSTRFA